MARADNALVAGITVEEALVRVRTTTRSRSWPPRPARGTLGAVGAVVVGVLVLGVTAQRPAPARPATRAATAASTVSARVWTKPAATTAVRGVHGPSAPVEAAASSRAPASSPPPPARTTSEAVHTTDPKARPTSEPRPLRPAPASASQSSPTTTGAPSPAPSPAPPTSASSTPPPSSAALAGWAAQYGDTVTTLEADVSAVEAAEPTPSGDYTAVVGSWEQLASDVASAQTLPAVPDATVEASWNDGLTELAGAVEDWLGSLTSTAPPSGTVADTARFDEGSSLFTEGTTDLGAVASAIAAS